MSDFLITLSPIILILVVTSFTVFIAILGMLIVRRYFADFFITTEDTPAASIFIRQISTLLAVLLAFVVISIWKNYEEQRENTGKEASALGNLYRDSRGLNSQTENEIQQMLATYTNDIVYDGWPKLKVGQESKVAWMSFNKLYGKVIKYEPINRQEEIVYANLIRELNDLAQYRRLRIIRSANHFMPEVLWVVIFSGSLLIIISGYFLKITEKKVYMFLTAINGLMLGLIFSTMLLLNDPYRGSLQISVSPIENLLKDVYPMAKITNNGDQEVRLDSFPQRNNVR